MSTTIHRRGTFPGAPSRRMPRPLLIAGAGLLAVLLLAAALLVGLRLGRSGALPGVQVAGVDVGGLDGEELRTAIADAGHADQVVTVTRGDASVRATGSEVGYVLDLDATEEAVLRRGRQANPLTALRDQMRAFTATPMPVDLVADVADGPLEQWVERVVAELALEPVEGTLVFEGASFQRVEPADGAVVDADAVRARTVEALLAGGPTTFEAPVEPVEPETTTAAVDAVAAAAERALSAPVILRRGEAALEVTPEAMAGLLRVERAGGDLALAVDREGVAGLADEDLRAALERDPVDAQVELTGDGVRIVESSDGFRFDAGAAADQLLEVATGDGPRDVELAGETIEPELTTAEAEALEIVEPVSEFTTNYQCCQSRVTNIQRIADIIDGALIKPGETFSVNDFVGPRTVEKGFVGGGAIFNGEFVEQIGGGVSQFATTMYNAAFFGGYEIPDSKRHSYYISRYPVGREATLNYPNVDLKVRNNSPYGIVVDTSYTSTSITVRFWGKKWVEVSDITGQRRNVTAPPTQVRENPQLAPGASRVVQSGRQGFDITVVRILQFPDGREEREEIFTRYLPEPRVVEQNSRRPEPPPEPEPEPEPEPTPEGEQEQASG